MSGSQPDPLLCESVDVRNPAASADAASYGEEASVGSPVMPLWKGTQAGSCAQFCEPAPEQEGQMRRRGKNGKPLVSMLRKQHPTLTKGWDHRGLLTEDSALLLLGASSG